MEAVKRILKNVKKIADEWVDVIALILPTGWALACYNGATGYLLSGDFIRFFGGVFVACISSTLLLGFGFWFSGLDLKSNPSPQLPLGRWKMFGIEIIVLLLITFRLA